MVKPTVEQIQEVLMELDPQDDEQWTKEGAPRMDILEELLEADPNELTRADIRKAAPLFNRDNMSLDADAEVEEDEPVDDQSTDESEPETEEAEAEVGTTEASMVRGSMAELEEELEARKEILAEAEASVVEARKSVEDAQDAVDELIMEKERRKRENPDRLGLMAHKKRSLEKYDRQAAARNAAPAEPYIAPVDRPRPRQTTPRGPIKSS